jgi:anti-anti-sigma factor
MMSHHELYNTREMEHAQIIDVNIESFDHRYIEDFKRAIANSLSHKKEVVLNLEAVNFMDSAGLGVILYGHRTCAQAGGTFAVCQAQGYVNKLFNLTGVNKAVKVFQNEDEAIGS